MRNRWCFRIRFRSEVTEVLRKLDQSMRGLSSGEEFINVMIMRLIRQLIQKAIEKRSVEIANTVCKDG